jgi:hypothetical protein
MSIPMSGIVRNGKLNADARNSKRGSKRDPFKMHVALPPYLTADVTRSDPFVVLSTPMPRPQDIPTIVVQKETQPPSIPSVPEKGTRNEM